jgi:hypothetical protein
MATDSELKADLLKKLEVTPQRLSQLVKARKAELPMSTELATYTIAHEKGLDLSKYLDQDTTREVRGLVADATVVNRISGQSICKAAVSVPAIEIPPAAAVCERELDP